MRIKTLLLLFLLASCTLEAQGYYLGVTGSLCASRIGEVVSSTFDERLHIGRQKGDIWIYQDGLQDRHQSTKAQHDEVEAVLDRR